MLIVCPHCASRYDIDTASFGSKGRPVRCGVCRTLWYVAVAEPDAVDDATPMPAAPRKRGFKEQLDVFVRGCSIVTMMASGAMTGFALTGEWPRWLIPFARVAGLEKPLWPELDGVQAKLEKTQEGATILTVDGEWVGAIRAIAAPAVEFAVRNSANEEVARWTDRSGPTKLPAGETVPFRSRFAVPGGDAREVSARYVGFTPDRAPSH